MRREINIVNQTKFRLPRQSLERTILFAAHYFQLNQISLSLIFNTASRMSALNRAYRGKPGPTDILSFTYGRGPSSLDAEIFICYSAARRQAIEFGHSLADEFKCLLVHGFVHCMGYDHETAKVASQMERIEKQLCAVVFKS